MRRLLLIMALALLCAACDADTTMRVSGRYTDGHGIARVTGIDTRDGAMLSYPAAQVDSTAQVGHCVRGTVYLQRVACP